LLAYLLKLGACLIHHDHVADLHHSFPNGRRRGENPVVIKPDLWLATEILRFKAEDIKSLAGSRDLSKGSQPKDAETGKSEARELWICA
jgi:hypothetical protein